MVAPSSHKGLIKLHSTLVLMQTIFAVATCYLVFSKSFVAPLQQYDHALQVVAVVTCFGGFYLGTNVLLKNAVDHIRKNKETVPQKNLSSMQPPLKHNGWG